jgi:hypothetical protein
LSTFSSSASAVDARAAEAARAEIPAFVCLSAHPCWPLLLSRV